MVMVIHWNIYIISNLSNKWFCGYADRIITYAPLISRKLYLSKPAVDPLLVPENTFTHFWIFESHTDITKSIWRKLPLYQATSMLHITFPEPELTFIHEGSPYLDHAVFRLLSTAYWGGPPGWLPLALIMLSGWAVQVFEGWAFDCWG